MQATDSIIEPIELISFNSDYLGNSVSNVTVDGQLERTCSLDYSSLPVINLQSLPLKVQHLIGNRIGRANLPLFILVTHKEGQWSMVQLRNSGSSMTPDGDDGDDNGRNNLELNKLGEICVQKLNGTSSLDMENNIQTNYSLKMNSHVEHIASMEFKIDSYTMAHYVQSSVHFKFMTKSDMYWHCPFCTAMYSLNSPYQVDILGQHMRLHVELRCCIDCATLLPNSLFETNFETLHPHRCNELVSPILKESNEELEATITPSKLLKITTQNSKSALQSEITISNHYSTSQQSVNKINLMPNNSNLILNCKSPDINLNLLPPNSTGVQGFTKILPALLTSDSCLSSNWSRVCTRCNMGFNAPAQYQQHLKNVHRGRRFVCQDCDASFSTKGNLTTHFNQVHNQNTGLQCHLCDKRLSNKFNMDRHIRTVHKLFLSNTPTVNDSTTAVVPNMSIINNNSGTSDSGANYIPSSLNNSHEVASGYNSSYCCLKMDSRMSVQAPILTSIVHHPAPSINPTSNASVSNPESGDVRGYYLYLSQSPNANHNLIVESNSNDDDDDNSHLTKLVLPNTNVNESVIEAIENDIPHRKSSNNNISLVAEIDLTPCLPSNPEAQIGMGGRTWKQNVHIL